jgi:TatD DNase family protein
MQIIDTHTHLYAEEFDRDREYLMQKAAVNGVSRFYLPNIDSGSIGAMLRLEAAYPDKCFAMMGLHPCSVKDDYIKELDIVHNWLQKRKFVAIGEIGIDLYWDKTFLAGQQVAFITQVQWALDYGYPIVIHCRESFEEIMDVLAQFKQLPPGIFHCFSGTREQANRVISLGFKLGIGGVLTFKNAGLDKAIETISPEHLVLETDAPYLAPAPFRGKRNEPSHILEVARKLADIQNRTLEEVADITMKNAFEVFGKS